MRAHRKSCSDAGVPVAAEGCTSRPHREPVEPAEFVGLHTDPASAVYDFKIPAYNASKSAVNPWTVHLAYVLRDTPIKVNAVHPGYVQTDMNGGQGEIDIPTGAKSSVDMALLGADGPTGTFTHLGNTLPW